MVFATKDNDSKREEWREGGTTILMSEVFIQHFICLAPFPVTLMAEYFRLLFSIPSRITST